MIKTTVNWLRRLLSHLGMIALFGVSGVSAKVDESGFNQKLDAVLKEEGLTGITWAMVDEGGFITVGATGFHDYPGEIAIDAGTKVHVGSLTKAVLATGVLKLVTEGKINLATPVAHYVPGVEINNPWRAVSPVTVRHLLDHTSGLDDARFWQLFSEKVEPKTPLVRAFSGAPDLLDVRVRPGTRFSYSNMGYTLLAAVIESVTGESYEDYLDTHLLKPLGMLDSTFGFTSQLDAGFDPDLAWGHTDGGKPYAAAAIYLRPAGQFTTTSTDLGRFAQFLMSDGTLNGVPFIKTELMNARGKPYGTDASNAGLVAGYGLGLGRRDRYGVIGYCHSGNIVGFSAMLCVYPDQGKAFAYSINTDSEVADYGRVEKIFVDAMTLHAADVPATKPMPEDVQNWEGYYTPMPKRFESFAYLDELFGYVKLEVEGDALLFAPLQGTQQILRPTGGYLFSSNMRDTNSHILIQHEGANPVISTGFQSYQKTATVKLAFLWLSLIGGLSGLMWFLVSGFAVSISRSSSLPGHIVFSPFVSVLLLAAPVPLFFTQSFMALGDKTPASIGLASVTLLLPIAMAVGLVRAFKKIQTDRFAACHAVAAVLALQWFAVLAFWGLLPFRLWG
jgi:CubicO group peptidase (beta-lactamase class C family)